MTEQITKSYHHGDLRAAFLDAVAEVVKERGVGHVSLRAAAARLGVTHAAATHHFGNKSGLLTAFAAQSFSLMHDYAMDAVQNARPPDGPALLAAGGRGYIRFAIEHPERFEVMFRLDLLNRGDPEYVAASDRAYGVLIEAVRRCEREGFLGGRDVETVAIGAWSIAHGLASLWISGRLHQRARETDPMQLAEAITELFVDSVLRANLRSG